MLKKLVVGALATGLLFSGGMSVSAAEFNKTANSEQLSVASAWDQTINLPTFFSGYHLSFHEPGMTYVTYNNNIKVSSTGVVTTYFSTTAKVFIYRDGVLDHTVTIIVGNG